MTLIEKYDAYFDQLLRKELTPNISIAMLKAGQIVYTYTGGLTETDGAPINEQTQFNIGSVSKTLTAALIIKLAELGKLTLEDKVQSYIKEYKHGEVTIHHLLTHSAGYTEFPVINWPKNHELAGYFKQIYTLELTAKPGEISSYFTYGYAIVMDIIERVSEQSIEQFARKYLFDPLSMELTTYDQSLLAQGTYVLPCKAEDNRWDTQLGHLATTGDSSVYSTAADLIKFAAMLLNNGEYNGIRVFTEDSVKLMLQESTNGQFAKTPVFWMKTEIDTYGCFGSSNSASAVGHPGFSGCMLLIDPACHTAIAIVTNSQRLHADFRNYGYIIDKLMHG